MSFEEPDAPGEPTVISPDPRLAGGHAAEFKKEIRAILSGGRDVILDLGEVSFVDSCGLDALVVACRIAGENGRRLSLCSIPKHVLALFHLTRLHRIFEIHPDRETARLLLDAVR